MDILYRATRMERTRAKFICLPVNGVDHAFATRTGLPVTLTMDGDGWGWMTSESTRIVWKAKKRWEGKGKRVLSVLSVPDHVDSPSLPYVSMGHPVPLSPSSMFTALVRAPPPPTGDSQDLLDVTEFCPTAKTASPSSYNPSISQHSHPASV